MRIVILGGTKFIGKAITDRMGQQGHELLVVHRGETEQKTDSKHQHLHTDRAALTDHKSTLCAFRPEAVIDTYCMNEHAAKVVLECFPPELRYVVLSSMDVYRAFGAVLSNTETDPLPITEDSPVRTTMYPHKGSGQPGSDDYEKLHVESVYGKVYATILRLPMVYGPFDPRRRENYILRRLRAGRKRIPIGIGNWLWTKGFVFDIANSVNYVLQSDTTRGEILNICETDTHSFAAWSKMILQAANSDAELVPVDEKLLPEDLGSLTKPRPQHLLVSNEKARRLLPDWVETDNQSALDQSVNWHLENPPEAEPFDPTEDDKALLSSTAVHTR